ncbi:MAG: HNH endonuclease, partial [Clostridia bacterium]
HALCKDCLDKNTITPYNTVHHIKPIKEDWSKRLELKYKFKRWNKKRNKI